MTNYDRLTIATSDGTVVGSATIHAPEYTGRERHAGTEPRIRCGLGRARRRAAAGGRALQLVVEHLDHDDGSADLTRADGEPSGDGGGETVTSPGKTSLAMTRRTSRSHRARWRARPVRS
jgi:hypothetical protein